MNHNWASVAFSIKGTWTWNNEATTVQDTILERCRDDSTWEVANIMYINALIGLTAELIVEQVHSVQNEPIEPEPQWYFRVSLFHLSRRDDCNQHLQFICLFFYLIFACWANGESMFCWLMKFECKRAWLCNSCSIIEWTRGLWGDVNLATFPNSSFFIFQLLFAGFKQLKPCIRYIWITTWKELVDFTTHDLEKASCFCHAIFINQNPWIHFV